ncbi:MAG: FGGY family carbohydrate kinase, partial [Treponemataceae bacterium]
MGLLGLDIGTSACKASVFATDGRLAAFASRTYATERGEGGEALVDSRQVDAAIRAVIAEAAAAARETAGGTVTAISAGSMGEAFVPLSRSGQILDRSILSVDRRGGEYLDLFSGIQPADLYRITPNIPGACYSFPKLRWVKDHQRELYDATWKFLFWADYAVFLLTGEAVAS